MAGREVISSYLDMDPNIMGELKRPPDSEHFNMDPGLKINSSGPSLVYSTAS